MKILQRARAKINWAIDVVGARYDGYHEIDMLMQSIELCDELTFEEADEISLEIDGVDLPSDETNLVIRAAKALNERSGINRGARIALKKFIPVGAGLGGGSADCAATLAALNRLWNLDIPHAELMEIGAGLGKDVPFCMLGTAARVTGAGEMLAPVVACKNMTLVIANPGAGLSTRDVYAKWDDMKGDIPRVDIDRAQRALARGGTGEMRLYMKNALEPAATALMPEIARVKGELLSLGADMALMTGSGSSVFGVFDDEAKARAAASGLTYRAILTRTV